MILFLHNGLYSPKSIVLYQQTMSSKFFNNSDGNTLFDKFKGIATGMQNFHSFLAVVGYFRSSGYFKLRRELKEVQDLRILVGINVDNIFKKQNPSLLALGGDEEAKEIYFRDFVQDVRDAKYSAEVEEGILHLCDDIKSGKLQLRIHKSKNLHAKFYLCLPREFSPNTDGWVIMGSSNISDSGLGITRPPQYELNVALKDYDDVSYCKEEFEALWSEGIAITSEDIVREKNKTHIFGLPSPYEIFFKVLIDAFGSQVEDDFTLEMPKGYMALKYQNDAAIQGFQMLNEYNGFFLADVVGTGKTVVAAMVAKRFVEENGSHSKILVVYPPAVKDNWQDTFRDFGLKKYTQFVTNGSLNKVIEEKGNYYPAGEFDLVIVDEAHNFRSDYTKRYDELQRICKTPRNNAGRVEGDKKKVMLLSATPLNNRPEDFRNLILLFQDARNPTIDGITNLTLLFQPWIEEYKELMSKRDKLNTSEITEAVDKVYDAMRTEVLDKILVRRTRKNLWNNEEYRADLNRQGIHFPTVEEPIECTYQLDKNLSELFFFTLLTLSETPNEEHPKSIGLHFARYRAIEFIVGGKAENYRNAVQFSRAFSGIFRVHMVKRLESSFYAFKKSLRTFLRITLDMIKMWDEDKIVIAPELDIKGMLMKDMEIDEIVDKAILKGLKAEDILFSREDFNPKYIEMLKEDAEKIKDLIVRWDKINDDPKYDLFKSKLETDWMKKTIRSKNGEEIELNKEGKLVVFSESVDTVKYLTDRLRDELHRNDVLSVDASKRKRVLRDIRANFDANYDGIKMNKYNIIITSDVLAEGVNLHRSNVIVNYDSPWNATRLFQRIGRVNRIGSTSDHIYNYMFYPSRDGDREIQLYKNALTKLQGFHSALGEDAQVYTREEVLRDFQLYDDKVKDDVDKRLELLREVRKLYAGDRELYNKIKSLPSKSRTVRSAGNRPGGVASKSTIVYITTGRRSQFYLVTEGNKPEKIELLQATDLLRARATEKSGKWEVAKSLNYDHVRRAFETYASEIASAEIPKYSLEEKKKDKNTTGALAFLRGMKRLFYSDELYDKILELEKYVDNGTFSGLTSALNKYKRQIDKETKSLDTLKHDIASKLGTLFHKYHVTNHSTEDEDSSQSSEIITSETFE